MANKKNFIIDTNVILHDYSFIENFEENDIYIPFVVLEELDKFKKGNEQINFNARAFVRELDLITDDNLFKQGADLGVGRGKLYIVNSVKTHDKIIEAFPERTPDNRILSTVLDVTEKHPKMKTILVTKDINLRMKARSLGIPVEDYINDKVIDIDVFGRGEQVIEGLNPELIDKIYAQPTGVDVDEFTFDNPLVPNDSFVLKSERNSVLARYNPFTQKIIRVDKEPSFGISPRNAEQTFALGVLNDPDIKLVGITGKA
ncbi:MAG TPA: ribonuclease, partial [Porphyromonadaceae bacterium]|nr:ribonuclease [Porphyromonadaceae bacterium]